MTAIAELKARKLELEIATAELELKRLERLEGNNGAAAAEACVYSLWGTIDKDRVQRCVDALSTWSRRSPGCDITLIINSPGGSVLDGLALYDFLKELAAGHHITTVAAGMAASMGGVLLQAGQHRVMGANAWMMIHEVSSLGVGKASDLEDEVKLVERLQTQLVAILSHRSTLTERQIRNRWKRRDWWLTASEAQSLGFCDEVR
ncbi:MAG: Clp protease ClpP [Actinomycetota bacterium]|nr:Clp protease ClpP [Actinomycetota bacterium]